MSTHRAAQQASCAPGVGKRSRQPDPVEAAVTLERVSKSFDLVKAVNDVSLQISKNEAFGLLGPSGCGKTTILRLIAGLEIPDNGNILLDGRTVVSMSNGAFLPPHKRNLGMVFQSYAIWPHMSVFDNVAYPLKVRNFRAGEIRRRVGDTLQLVNLDGLEDRQGPQLSGGQQQRVALARALVYEPSVLLLDEPFSNLDARLREQMRLQVKLLLEKLEITVILVTHDQVEGLSLSNRIAVLNEGRVEQIGTPQDVYRSPETAFVRDFLGNTVLLRCLVQAVDDSGHVTVGLPGASNIAFTVPAPTRSAIAAGEEALVAIRPEDIEIGSSVSAAPGSISLPATVETELFVGDHYECCVRLFDGTLVTLRVMHREERRKGATITLCIPETAVRLWRA